MRKPNSKAEFFALTGFLLVLTLLLTNGFTGRIFAQSEQEEIYEKIAPIGEVLSAILDNYVYEPDLDKAVENALKGIMASLDRNSSYIPAEQLRELTEDTEGQFEGIGVYLSMSEEGYVYVAQPIPGAPAIEAGMKSGDIIIEVDGVSMDGLDVSAAARRIKGPRGVPVLIKVLRGDPEGEFEHIEFEVKRGKIPLESILEAQMLEGGIGYVRVSDFKKHTADDLKDRVKDMKKEGLQSLIVDLRWNPGGLLNASRDVCELFLPKNTLVTYTKGREGGTGRYTDDMKLYTQRSPIVPETMPIIVLVNGHSASSAEIVTGAMQYYERGLIVGSKTFGKGSVQTIIPLARPEDSALRLTTQLYYTPSDVTIDQVGIEPDVEVEMEEEVEKQLRLQMFRSFENDAERRYNQDHGRITGNTDPDAVQDVVLERAVEILQEDTVFANLIEKYHRDVADTQKQAREVPAPMGHTLK